MRALQIHELGKWFDESTANIQVEPTGYLRYRTGDQFGIRIDLPPEASRVVALAASLLAIEEDEGFYGALIWFTNWDIGTPQIERCGLKILEKMRHGYGVTASLENSPGQLFRSDELVDAHAFLTLPLFFGWDAFFMPHATRYFAYIRQNASLFLVTDSEQVSEKLMTFLRSYHPVLELPSYLRVTPTPR